jgi:hypothetical protein
MAFAQFGPLTSLVESAAAAVGAAMVFAGFLVGLHGVLAGLSRRVLEGRTLEAAYLGGAAGASASLVDIIFPHSSDMPKLKLRNANIALAVMMVFFVGGRYLFRDSELGLTISVLGGFVASVSLMIFLSERDERRRERDQ